MAHVPLEGSIASPSCLALATASSTDICACSYAEGDISGDLGRSRAISSAAICGCSLSTL